MDYPVAWAQDATGNFYILGQICDSDPDGNLDIWFAKYWNGAPFYEIQKGGANFILDTSGTAYVIGAVLSRERGLDIWCDRVTSAGDAAWELTNKIGDEEDAIMDIISLQSGWIKGE